MSVSSSLFRLMPNSDSLQKLTSELEVTLQRINRSLGDMNPECEPTQLFKATRSFDPARLIEPLEKAIVRRLDEVSMDFEKLLEEFWG